VGGDVLNNDFWHDIMNELAQDPVVDPHLHPAQVRLSCRGCGGCRMMVGCVHWCWWCSRACCICGGGDVLNGGSTAGMTS
jgi:hypothetical protein